MCVYVRTPCTTLNNSIKTPRGKELKIGKVKYTCYVETIIKVIKPKRSLGKSFTIIF